MHLRATRRTLSRPLAGTLIAAALLPACGGGEGDPTPADGAGDAGNGAFSSPIGSDDEASEVVGPAGLVLPPLDLERQTVPLDQVFFDTFNGGTVRLDDASVSLIDSLRDAIAPLFFPDYDGVEGGDWLDPNDLVLTYVDEAGQAYAYPRKILNFHEVVNDELAGVPVLVSYCPLCRSGVVFDRRLGEATLIFGNTSALYESDLVMFDWQTNSYWWQVPGRAIVGTLAGEELAVLPSQTHVLGALAGAAPGHTRAVREHGLPHQLPARPVRHAS